MKITRRKLNVTGLVLGLLGVILLSFWALPASGPVEVIGGEGTQADENTVLAWLGLACVLVGYSLQITAEGVGYTEERKRTHQQ